MGGIVMTLTKIECGFENSAQELFTNVGEDSGCVSLGAMDAMGVCDQQNLNTVVPRSYATPSYATPSYAIFEATLF